MKTSRNPDKLPICTISEGTLRTPDLLAAYLSAASMITLKREERAAVQRIQHAYAKSGGEYPEAQTDLDDLHLILEDHAPDYTNFGSNPGDDEHIGVFPDWDAIEYEVKNGAISKGESLPKLTKGYDQFITHFVVVNDHGNATMYRRTGRRWVEVWSIV